MGKIFSTADIDELGDILRPWGETPAQSAARTPPMYGRPPNSQPLGTNTGAPPRTRIFQVQVTPGGVRLVGPDKQNRQVVVTPPFNAFGVVLSFTGRPDINGFPIPPALPYEMIIPGFQEVWAATTAPVLIPVLVQVGPLLVGDLERRWGWESV